MNGMEDILRHAHRVQERLVKFQEQLGDLAFASMCREGRFDEMRKTVGHSMLDVRPEQGNLEILWP